MAALQYSLGKAHILFHFLSNSFIFFHFLSFSFKFFHFLSFSFHSLSFSFIFFHVLSLSFIVFTPFFHFFFFLFFFFSGAQNPHFVPAVSGSTPLGRPLLFFSRLFFIVFAFSFSFSISFHAFLVFPFVFLLKKCFFLFHFVSLFSFLGCSKSVAALQDSLVKSVHSELPSFALYWFVVTFPCGIVHILVIKLKDVNGGRRVGQVLPSYQNRQISALDETADAPQSSPFSLLPSPFSLLSSPFSLLPSLIPSLIPPASPTPH